MQTRIERSLLQEVIALRDNIMTGRMTFVDEIRELRQAASATTSEVVLNESQRSKLDSVLKNAAKGTPEQQQKSQSLQKQIYDTCRIILPAKVDEQGLQSPRVSLG